MATDPVGDRYGMVYVEGIGYRKIGPAYALQALGHKVLWSTKDEDPDKIKPLQYKEDTEP